MTRVALALSHHRGRLQQDAARCHHTGGSARRVLRRARRPAFDLGVGGHGLRALRVIDADEHHDDRVALCRRLREEVDLVADWVGEHGSKTKPPRLGKKAKLKHPS